MTIDISRPIIFCIRLSQEEDKAIRLLAKMDGLPKSLYARRVLHQAFRDAVPILPPKLVNALNVPQVKAEAAS